MKKMLFLVTLLCGFVVGPVKAAFVPMVEFELSCVGCQFGGDFSVSWTTTLNANQASGFDEFLPGEFFKIEPTVGSVFWAHSSNYPNGYNYDGPEGNASMFGIDSSLIFSGPTSAPIWLVGTYVDTVNYFQQGENLGIATLTISNVPVSAPSSIGVLLTLFGGLMMFKINRKNT